MGGPDGRGVRDALGSADPTNKCPTNKYFTNKYFTNKYFTNKYFMDERLLDEYRALAPIYDLVVEPFIGRARRDAARLARRAAGEGPRLCLDVACGTGAQLRLMRQAGFKCLGLDRSRAMLREAHGKGPPDIVYLLGSSERLPFADQTLDVVGLSLCLHEMDEPLRHATLAEARRVLKPAGSLLALDYLAPEDLASRLAGLAMHIPEALAGQRHYRSFKRFLRQGGLLPFLAGHSFRLIEVRKHAWGGLGLVWAAPTAR